MFVLWRRAEFAGAADGRNMVPKCSLANESLGNHIIGKYGWIMGFIADLMLPKLVNISPILHTLKY